MIAIFSQLLTIQLLSFSPNNEFEFVDMQSDFDIDVVYQTEKDGFLYVQMNSPHPAFSIIIISDDSADPQTEIAKIVWHGSVTLPLKKGSYWKITYGVPNPEDFTFDNISIQFNTIGQLIDTGGFWDNFFWPLMVALVLAIGGLSWNFLMRKRFKIKINLNNSFIGIHNGHPYCIIKIDIINEKSNSINNLRISSTPKYPFLNDFSTNVGGEQTGSGEIVFPIAVDLIKDVIDATQPVNLGAQDKLEGNLIIDLQSHTNRLEVLEFNYLTKTIKKKIDFDHLIIRHL